MFFVKQKFDIKQLKMNNFINSMWQSTISTLNATLAVPLLRPCILPDRLKNANGIEAFKMQKKECKPKNGGFTSFMFKMSVLFKKTSIKGKNEKFHVKHKFMILCMVFMFNLQSTFFQCCKVDVS